MFVTKLESVFCNVSIVFCSLLNVIPRIVFIPPNGRVMNINIRTGACGSAAIIGKFGEVV